MGMKLEMGSCSLKFIDRQIGNVTIAGGQRPAECAFHFRPSSMLHQPPRPRGTDLLRWSSLKEPLPSRPPRRQLHDDACIGLIPIVFCATLLSCRESNLESGCLRSVRNLLDVPDHLLRQ
jgi:hypothetical protein